MDRVAPPQKYFLYSFTTTGLGCLSWYSNACSWEVFLCYSSDIWSQVSGGDPEGDRKPGPVWSTLLLEERGKRNGFGMLGLLIAHTWYFSRQS